MAERDPLQNLEMLARATEDVHPTGDFVDAVMAKVETSSAAEVLAKAQRETANLSPSHKFTDAIMRAVDQTERSAPKSSPAWSSPLVRFSRLALAGAAAAAALSLWLSSQAQSSFDAAILGDVAAIEVDE